MAKIVLTGGGTAGHIMPNLALVHELKKYFESIHYIGGNGMEKDIVPKADIPFHSTPTIKLDRTHIMQNIKIPLVLLNGIKQAKKILTLLAPDVIFSKGGYASLPTCFAAKALNIPVVIHESDYSLGVANKLVSSFASKVLTAFPETEGVYVGNPIREEIFLGKKQNITAKYNLDINKKTLLFLGGSQGSVAINGIVYIALPLLSKSYNILHIAGNNGDFNVHANHYHQLTFTDAIADFFACADCVICRAGANTLAEVTALGKRAIVVPLPKGNSRGDQMQNAQSYAKKNLVTIIEQENFCVESLIFTLNKIFESIPPISNNSQANQKIVKEILSVIK